MKKQLQDKAVQSYEKLLEECEITHYRCIPCVYCDGKELLTKAIDRAFNKGVEEGKKVAYKKVLENKSKKMKFVKFVDDSSPKKDL